MYFLRYALLITTFTVPLVGCSSDADRPDGQSSSASASSGPGTGGNGASGDGGASSGGTGGASTGGVGGAGQGGAGEGGAISGEVGYRAVNLITDVPRFVLTKKNIVTDVCFQLRVANLFAGDSASITEPGPPFEELLAMQGAAKCGDTDGPPPEPPPPDAVAATVAFGDIAVSDPPCSVTANLTLGFQNPPAWLGNDETIAVTALAIEQGCP